MGYIFREGSPNFPKDETELNERLTGVEKFINPAEEISKVNVKFVLVAGKLMEDCGLITENNLRFLCDAAACRNLNPDFKFPYNPGEGALRAVDDDDKIHGADGCPRFYRGKKRRLELLNGQHYLFSNDWYPFNKKQFFLWLAMNARKNCETVWNRQVSTNPFGGDEKITIEITDELLPESNGEKLDAVTVNTPDDSAKVVESLKDLHAKVDAVTRNNPYDFGKVVESLKILHSNVDAVTANQLDDSAKVIKTLESLHEKVDALTSEVKELKSLNAKVDKLTATVEELKNDLW
ncbi:MAG: hypothetical protein IJ685_03070 [Selenomonadaceae bacterium]|nr:hypothetical protein [Selenomonadaceae bacterium]